VIYTLSAQLEQRNFEDTRARLEAARELLLSYAIVNARLPCPATAASSGDEALTGGPGTSCSSPYGGFLPARTIGYQVVDAGGYAVDPWQNRLRYAVSAASTAAPSLVACAGTFGLPHFTHKANLKQNGITCQPNDLVICKSATGITGTSCGAAANVLTNQNVVVAIVYSVGKSSSPNGSSACPPATCIDEAANLNGDQVFVSHPPAPAGATNGEFDDYLIWITVGEFYGRLISAGVLP
jgi:hypothetical protein